MAENKSELEARITEAEGVLRELKERRQQERETLQHAEIDRLEEHLESARVHLADFRPAADAAWSEIRRGVEGVLAELRRLLDEFKKRG